MAKAQAEVLTATADLTHEEWLAQRTKGIGGSDASIILGLNKYKTPFELWLEKTGQTDLEDTAGEAAYFGNILEDMVAKEFEIRSGKKVRKRNAILKHPEHPYILANIDRKVVGEQAVLECKTASMFLAKDWESEEIPEAYLVQVQHYLGVTGYEKAYIAVLIGGQRFVWKEIERDKELIEMIFEAEVHFWEHHVKQGIPPALDGSSAAEKFLKERYEKSNPDLTVDLAHAYKSKIEQYHELKDSIKKLETQKKQLENEMKNELKEAETGFIHNYQVNWKPIVSNRVDTKYLKKEFPEIYKKVTKPSKYRKFEVKEIS
ncbi:YqaJ viral recombinase family protein [Sediminibacillus massiliensis]|uniref:YqaJ viral recombinase family nuclease n=1 Tax=Sediminibacillus massiliensis TaxID=1926277 RepID=UPI0009887F53|nr:YqaJ viral recombinase family protein [Sediminibacillus massiliensis]